MKPNITQPISGFAYLLRGFRLITQKGLRRFVVIPLLINIVIFAMLFGLGIHYFSLVTHWAESQLPAWLDWLSWLLWLLFAIGGFLLATYSFTLIATIIAAPFNALLAEKVQQHLKADKTASEGSWLDFIKEIGPTMRREWHKLSYYLPRAAILLLLFFIPVIGIIAPIVWFIFNAWMLSLQYIDYNFENNRIEFPEGRRQLRQHKWQALGFGSSITILTMIPIINFFVMPAAVAGATAFWATHMAQTEHLENKNIIL